MSCLSVFQSHSYVEGEFMYTCMVGYITAVSSLQSYSAGASAPQALRSFPALIGIRTSHTSGTTSSLLF